jgi:hypothetical protein
MTTENPVTATLPMVFKIFSAMLAATLMLLMADFEVDGQPAITGGPKMAFIPFKWS